MLDNCYCSYSYSDLFKMFTAFCSFKFHIVNIILSVAFRLT